MVVVPNEPPEAHHQIATCLPLHCAMSTAPARACAHMHTHAHTHARNARARKQTFCVGLFGNGGLCGHQNFGQRELRELYRRDCTRERGLGTWGRDIAKGAQAYTGGWDASRIWNAVRHCSWGG